MCFWSGYLNCVGSSRKLVPLQFGKSGLATPLKRSILLSNLKIMCVVGAVLLSTFLQNTDENDDKIIRILSTDCIIMVVSRPF